MQHEARHSSARHMNTRTLVRIPVGRAVKSAGQVRGARLNSIHVRSGGFFLPGTLPLPPGFGRRRADSENCAWICSPRPAARRPRVSNPNALSAKPPTAFEPPNPKRDAQTSAILRAALLRTLRGSPAEGGEPLTRARKACKR